MLQAHIAGSLWQQTKALGLSLGDRACLALAIQLNLPVLTADKLWQQLDVGVAIQLIRYKRMKNQRQTHSRIIAIYYSIHAVNTIANHDST
jgi:ABC-type antimicrobial peptide transport system ATPase subunit